MINSLPPNDYWFKMRSRNRSAVLAKLLDREWAYVPITAHLLQSTISLRGARFRLFFTQNEKSVSDVALVSNDGLLLTAFDDFYVTRRNPVQYGQTLRDLVGDPGKLHSSMGPTLDVQRAECLLRLRPRKYFDHTLMTFDRDQILPTRTVPKSVTIRQATIQDSDRMLPLREAYELEEVVLDPLRFSRDDCFSRLKYSLRHDLIYVAEHLGRPVATATATARGIKVDQIGGVFTSQPYRRRGLATSVILALLRDIFNRKHQASLFVKESNAPAKQLYQNLGFSSRIDYRISYYR